MKGKAWILGVSLVLLTSWVSAAELPSPLGGGQEVGLPSADEPDYVFSMLETTELAETEEELIAILNEKDQRFLALDSCGARCDWDSCICVGSESCCNDVCNKACGLCPYYPCFMTGEEPIRSDDPGPSYGGGGDDRRRP